MKNLQTPAQPAARGSINGFTLIELLVVISILAVLSAMVIATVPMMRDAATRTQCASNLRQVGMVALLYAENWDGEFPPQNPNPNFWSSPEVNGVPHGIGLLMESLTASEGAGSGKAFFCPGSLNTANSISSYSQTQATNHDWKGFSRYGYTYQAGLRDTGSNWGDPPFGYPAAQLGQVTGAFKANERILIGTSRVVAVDGHSHSLALAVLAADWICKFGNGSGSYNTAINHPAGGPLVPGRGGANVVHGDGHVEWYGYQRDTIDDWWVSYALWKTDYVLQ